ncbi:MAG TPA: hypothetical protein VHI71_07145 [Actinomycetota bacterium]|nr:hypothetical protein [Actinomycetota bacterium]
MDRIKSRIALLLAAAAVSTVFVAPPARAADNCHPFPEVYCNTTYYLQHCVFRRPPADWCDA